MSVHRYISWAYFKDKNINRCKYDITYFFEAVVLVHGTYFCNYVRAAHFFGLRQLPRVLFRDAPPGISSVRSEHAMLAIVRDPACARWERERDRERERRKRANALARSTACHVGAISSPTFNLPGSLGSKLRRAAPSSTADGGLIMELTERLTFDSISDCLAI